MKQHSIVTITDDDRRMDLTFAAVFDYRGATKDRSGYRDGGEPGESPAVELERAVFVEGCVWFGDYAMDITDLTCSVDVTKGLRRELMDKYKADIEAKILEQMQVTA